MPSYLNVIALNRDKSKKNKLLEELRTQVQQLKKKRKGTYQVTIWNYCWERKQGERFNKSTLGLWCTGYKVGVSVKNIMGQIGENLVKNLFNEIQDSKREMAENANQEMTERGMILKVWSDRAK